MNRYNHESITIDFHGRKVTLVRRIPLNSVPLYSYWHDPNTGDVYDVDRETGEVTLIFSTIK